MPPLAEAAAAALQLPRLLLRTREPPDSLSPGLLPAAAQQQGGGTTAVDPAIDQAQDLAPLVGFFLSLTLTSLCFWRLAAFTTAALKYRWQRPK